MIFTVKNAGKIRFYISLYIELFGKRVIFDLKLAAILSQATEAIFGYFIYGYFTVLTFPMASTSPVHRINGIDSLRFISALIVLLGHNGVALPDTVVSTIPPVLTKLASNLLGILFNGPAAVIAFFIISGFCIHYPNQNKINLDIPSFYIRRFVRIGIPAILAWWICIWVDRPPTWPYYGVFWSVFCELIYYSLYPILWRLRRSVNWNIQIAVAYALSLAVGVYYLPVLKTNADYPAIFEFTWLIGLPCWLMGCWLAENYQQFRSLPPLAMWVVRLGIFGLTVLLRIAKFHLPLPYASNIFSLNAFAFIACFWIGLEIMYYQRHKAPSILEWGGQWSYSLYLIHPAIGGVLILMGISEESKIWGFVFSLMYSYLFYLMVEKPSHLLAIRSSKMWKRVRV